MHRPIARLAYPPAILCALTLAAACSTMPPKPELTARCEREIVELHQFFEDWFAGKLPDTDAAFARFADALHPDFHIIPPNGSVLDRAAILERLRAAHGRTANASPPFVIEVRAVQRRSAVDGGVVLTYEEWQGAGTPTEGRTSSVLMRRHDSAPNGLQWVHVHETALAPN